MIGSRWIHLGSRVRIRIGEAVHPGGYPRDKAGAAAMTSEVEARLQALLEGVVDRDPPGPLGRTISEAFNDRSWLDEASTTTTAAGHGHTPGSPPPVEPGRMVRG
jgi:hypothetical protein